MALMPTERMGPPPGASPSMRMTASWSGSNDPTVYKSVATKMSPLASSPRILHRQTGHRPDAELCKKPPSPATGRRTAFPAPNKELAINRKHHLTGKAPYKCLVRERTRIVNRMKGTFARLGIRNFKPTLRKAAERLATLHTPEGSVLPPNVSAELQRNMARLGVVVSQIKEIEGARQKRLEQEPETEPHAMVRLLARVVGVGVETADILVNEVLSRPMRDRKAVARYAGLTGSPDES